METDTASVAESPFSRRRAGVLLHPTSLPFDPAGGALGAEARHFIDFLASTGASVWQTLPLGPTHADGSPYACLSVFAGSPELLSVQSLQQSGWIDRVDAPAQEIDAWRLQMLRRAQKGFARDADAEQRRAYEEFRERQRYWLDDYCLYQALRRKHGGRSWLAWPATLRDREAAALEKAKAELAVEREQVCFEQFAFDLQWRALKSYANERGILLFGDMPIFVAHDSAEVWARPDLFTLDEHGNALTVAGVPPDYFSATGQRWGNPLYRWERMGEDDFDWWLRRVGHQLDLFDLVRIDHFRGFQAYWEIPANAETAVDGKWVEAPGDALFEALQARFDPLPLVAEDLGLITPEVDALRQRFGLPGMKILQFAFEGGATNPYLPHNHESDYVVYTGTHDNSTTVGWFAQLEPELQQRVQEYLGYPQEPQPWPLIRSALASVAQLCVLPMQDLLALDDQHRMNVPGVAQGNWGWRFDWDMVEDALPARLKGMIELYGRLPDDQE